jgi:outer membrane protein assembly factor BamB
MLYIADVSPAGYKELSSGKVLEGKAKVWTAPTICDGMIYCRNASGDLVSVDVR